MHVRRIINLLKLFVFFNVALLPVLRKFHRSRTIGTIHQLELSIPASLKLLRVRFAAENENLLTKNLYPRCAIFI